MKTRCKSEECENAAAVEGYCRTCADQDMRPQVCEDCGEVGYVDLGQMREVGDGFYVHLECRGHDPLERQRTQEAGWEAYTKRR